MALNFRRPKFSSVLNFRRPNFCHLRKNSSLRADFFWPIRKERRRGREKEKKRDNEKRVVTFRINVHQTFSFY